MAIDSKGRFVKIDLDVDLICKRYVSGESASQIGRDLQVSKSTILNRIEIAGIEKRPRYERSDKKADSLENQCTIEGCFAPILAKGLCLPDYQSMNNAKKKNGRFCKCGELLPDTARICDSCRYKMLHCAGCDGPITDNNRSGFCRKQCNAEVEYGIFGIFPKEDEVSIYLLKRNSVVFYVGQTHDPIRRIATHRRRLEGCITMVIVRNVLKSQSVLEECREIVNQSDSGVILDNLVTPSKSIQGR